MRLIGSKHKPFQSVYGKYMHTYLFTASFFFFWILFTNESEARRKTKNNFERQLIVIIVNFVHSIRLHFCGCLRHIVDWFKAECCDLMRVQLKVAENSGMDFVFPQRRISLMHTLKILCGTDDCINGIEKRGIWTNMGIGEKKRSIKYTMHLSNSQPACFNVRSNPIWLSIEVQRRRYFLLRLVYHIYLHSVSVILFGCAIQ